MLFPGRPIENSDICLPVPGARRDDVRAVPRRLYPDVRPRRMQGVEYFCVAW